MCFNQPFTIVFAVLGTAMSVLVYKMAGQKKELLIGTLYFVLMEILQAFQYIWIDDCDSKMNKALTVVGLVHICYQPFFTHYMNYGLASRKKKGEWVSILKFCFIAGTQLVASSVLGMYTGVNMGEGSTDWLSGTRLCTYKGNKHLAWSIPLYPTTYFNPGSNIHFFVMFMPFFVMSHMRSALWLQGLFLMLTGPVLSVFVTSNLHEQASIWCYLSILQISVMMALLMVMVIMRRKPVEKKRE